jgi:hypothetical protein
LDQLAIDDRVTFMQVANDDEATIEWRAESEMKT